MKNVIKITILTFVLTLTANIAFAQQPTTAKEWFEIGNGQNNEKKYSEAIESFSECIRLDKTAFSCYLNRGIAYYNLKKSSEAIVDYSKAIEFNSTFAYAFVNRGVAYAELKKYEEAKKDFTKALELDPSNEAARDSLSNLKKTSTLNTSKTDISDKELELPDSSIFDEFNSMVENLKENSEDKCISGNCVNGKGKMVNGYGDIYEGGFVNGKREGQGTYTYKNGTVYIGQYANDLTYGKGKMTYYNGDIYEGDWVNGSKEGKGTYTLLNGNNYTGEWKNDVKNGYGKEFDKAKKLIREGTWKDGAFVGAANTTVPDQTVSVGEISSLLRQTLNGKFDFMESKRLVYVLTMKKSNESFRYKIQFDYGDDDEFAFKWDDSNNFKRSEKMVITDKAFASASKYVNILYTKSTLSPDTEITFILSQKLYQDLKANNEISLDLGNGQQTLFFKDKFTPPSGVYTNKDVKKLHFQTKDEKTKIQILDDPVCPLIVGIETPEYTLTLVKGM